MIVTTAERWAIAAGLAAAMLAARAFVVALLWIAGAPTGPGVVMVAGTMTIVITLLLPLPLFMEVIQRSAQWRRSSRLFGHLICALLYVTVSGFLAVAGALIIQPTTFTWDVAGRYASFLANIPGAIIIYSTSVAMVRALQWYRASFAAEAVRQELESKEVNRTRLLLERRYRPATIVSLLRRIESLLPADPQLAEALLHQLARYARLLLRGSAGPPPTLQSDLRAMRAALVLRGVRTEVVIDRTAAALLSDGENLTGAIEGAAVAAGPASIIVTCASDAGEQIVRVTAAGHLAKEFSDALEDALASSGSSVRRVDDVCVALRLTQPRISPPALSHDSESRREPRSLSVTLLALVLAYGITATLLDLREARVSSSPTLAMSRILSFLAWPLAGLVVAWMAARMTRWRLRWAVVGAALVSVASAVIVSAIVQMIMAIFGLGSGDPREMLYDSYYILMRNVIIGEALMAMTFAQALARVLIATNREATRLRDDVGLAESREIEARFHPHFLFNALTLIASLIDTDLSIAAAMCRRLSDLVEKAVTSAGLERWTLRQELDLAADYLAVQTMRFSNRLRIETWEIPSAANEAIIPRLVLQPLLENVFKHGVACNTGPTAIGLSVKKRGKRLAVTLWNDIEPTRGPIIPGRGLTFVQRRLAAAGGELTIDGTDNDTDVRRFVVRVSAPVS